MSKQIKGITRPTNYCDLATLAELCKEQRFNCFIYDTDNQLDRTDGVHQSIVFDSMTISPDLGVVVFHCGTRQTMLFRGITDIGLENSVLGMVIYLYAASSIIYSGRIIARQE